MSTTKKKKLRAEEFCNLKAIKPILKVHLEKKYKEEGKTQLEWEKIANNNKHI